MLVQYSSAANISIKNKSRKYFAGFILKCCAIMLFLTIFTQYGNLLAECIGQQIGYHSGAIYIIMCIVLLALWVRWALRRVDTTCAASSTPRFPNPAPGCG